MNTAATVTANRSTADLDVALRLLHPTGRVLWLALTDEAARQLRAEAIRRCELLANWEELFPLVRDGMNLVLLETRDFRNNPTEA